MIAVRARLGHREVERPFYMATRCILEMAALAPRVIRASVWPRLRCTTVANCLCGTLGVRVEVTSVPAPVGPLMIRTCMLLVVFVPSVLFRGPKTLLPVLSRL